MSQLPSSPPSLVIFTAVVLLATTTVSSDIKSQSDFQDAIRYDTNVFLLLRLLKKPTNGGDTGIMFTNANVRHFLISRTGSLRRFVRLRVVDIKQHLSFYISGAIEVLRSH